jgi:hypothetical protein
MPILGILASSRPAFELVGSYDSLATVTLSATTASVTFAGIPSSYKHLQIRMLAKTDRATYSIDSAKFQLNGDTGSNYAWHRVLGDGSSAAAYSAASTAFMQADGLAAQGTNIFGAMIVDILDYANTSKYKTARMLGGEDENGTTYGGGVIAFNSSLWQNTAAISSIKIFPGAGTNFLQYSSFALYGVK